MENGKRSGSHTNHDRDQRSNGINGAGYVSEKATDKGKGRAETLQNVTPVSPTVPNGINGGFMSSSSQRDEIEELVPKARMGQLPPEIVHITEGFFPISKLLGRLAQKTHNDLVKTIQDLTQMPMPLSVADGNGPQISRADDDSKDNMDKKLRLLKFAQESHTEWTKALVMSEWSRRSEDVSKLIDINNHLYHQICKYGHTIHELSELKRGLVYARLPNPDLKTALHVLTTGTAPWMPDLMYIEPPPLSPKDILKSLENINTLLSIRLNLNDYDNIPFHFKEYTINSGRVTFKVKGEFEVDLTIAEENPEAQFWFIDFRFLFSPAASDLGHLRAHIENRVNRALAEGGLSDCYRFLHGMVLNHKISEFRRQAVSLSRGKWVETLKVESLNRAVSMQYWVDRYGHGGPKSWLILGVHSGKPKSGVARPKDTPRLFVRWFLESKEVIGEDVVFDTVNISAESLLKTVIASHIKHILVSTYSQLSGKPLYTTLEAAIALKLSNDQPSESELNVQISSDRQISLKIEPIAGRFIYSPASRLVMNHENRLNYMPDPATNAHKAIDDLRYDIVADHISTRGASVGWVGVQNPGLERDDLQKVVPKGTVKVLWFKRNGWVKNWYLTASIGSSGESWRMIETADPVAQPAAPLARKPVKSAHLKISSSFDLPMKILTPLPTYSFFTTLEIYAAALMSHHANLKSLHTRRVPNMLHESKHMRGLMKIPIIFARISDLVEWRNKAAKDMIKLNFQGLEIKPGLNEASPMPPVATLSNGMPVLDDNVVMITEARISIRLPSALKYAKEKIDRDVAFEFQSNCLALRLRSKIGESVIPNLVEHTTRVFRLIEFIKVLQEHSASLECQQISLGKIAFTYGMVDANGNKNSNLARSSMQYKAVIDFSAAANTLSLILERGNPHLQIADFMEQVLNSKQGLRGVATLLPLTLPVLNGLNAVESAWVSVSKDEGEVFVLARAADWHEIRYAVFTASRDPSTPPRTRKILFEIKLRERSGVPWWSLERTDQREPDDFDEALKPVWNSSGPGFQGMRVSGVAQGHGVEQLLKKVDDAVRNMVISQKALGYPPKPRPQAPMQRLQQPTPNSSQSQGRKNPLKREIVEID
ncbi:mediator complex subunit MED14-domain-containing protein [Amylocarpus encephaloides]|uniref:Mediator of RNA polymerase II transcription subunit 14 n=1 Tax=Amylocarpus encephaloides TaxID=45428 RepID=A0A9P7YMN5_9HELO|nr:mediator complex subunit MED14-domain-containing protein [Amylocarpus encephaloides]